LEPPIESGMRRSTSYSPGLMLSDSVLGVHLAFYFPGHVSDLFGITGLRNILQCHVKGCAWRELRIRPDRRGLIGKNNRSEKEYG
jgi:hypothetical protein